MKVVPMFEQVMSAFSFLGSIKRFLAQSRERLGWLMLVCSLAVLFVVLVAAAGVGAMPLSAGKIFQIIMQLFGWVDAQVASEAETVVFLHIRLPRVLFGAIAGAALAAAGAAMQGLFRNPLADPGLIGVSSGAALAAVATILFWTSFASGISTDFLPYVLPVAAMIGGVIAVFIVYRLSVKDGEVQVATMLLAGVALNAMVGAFMGFAVFLSDDQQLRDINFWMLGSLASARWSIMVPVIICAVIPLVFIYSQARTLNAFLLGEREAHYLGFNVEKSKRLLLFLAAALTGGIVAFAGMIGFVGLVVPHIVRMLIGPDHRWLLPNSMILGALLMVLADLFARTMVVPAELPLGVVTSALGAPFFIWLLSSGKARMSG